MKNNVNNNDLTIQLMIKLPKENLLKFKILNNLNYFLIAIVCSITLNLTAQNTVSYFTRLGSQLNGGLMGRSKK